MSEAGVVYSDVKFTREKKANGEFISPLEKIS